jgi:hypothetical protein
LSGIGIVCFGPTIRSIAGDWNRYALHGLDCRVHLKLVLPRNEHLLRLSCLSACPA